MNLCVIFPDIPNALKKVVYKPVVDKFEVLSLKGFYSLITNVSPSTSIPFNPNLPDLKERRIMIMAEQNISRPIVRFINQ